MKPDRVIGLRAPSRIPQNASHFPVTGRRILLPFLVVEAKKEEDAPGFRAIQYQTAFPVRRLLKAQDDLRSREQSSEPCLVWFFAYQGEQWRLHTGTYENDKVKIYDLWQGTIQSQDGALQLLLIVDYIWSWARDIYRPSVRKLLFDSTSFRDFSPASTDRFRQSVSLSSAPSPAPTTHDLDLMQVDEVVVDIERPGGPYQRVDHGSQEIEEQETAVIKDASSHAFLRWAVGHELAPSWTELGSIRYSNIVRFEFRCLEVWRPEIVKVKRADPGDRLIFDILSSLAFLIHPEQLYELAALWTTNSASIPELNLRKAIRATFFFQTYCDQSTWQIKRVLNCILWRTEPCALISRADIDHLPAYVGGDGNPRYFEMNDLKRTILDTQQIYGRDSVWYALRNVSMALLPGKESPGPKWVSFDEEEMPEKASEFLMGLAEHTDLGEIVISCVNLCGGLLKIDPGFERRLRSTIPDLGRDTQNGDSMLAVRSPSWPAMTAALGIDNEKDPCGSFVDKNSLISQGGSDQKAPVSTTNGYIQGRTAGHHFYVNGISLDGLSDEDNLNGRNSEIKLAFQEPQDWMYFRPHAAVITELLKVLVGVNVRRKSEMRMLIAATVPSRPIRDEMKLRTMMGSTGTSDKEQPRTQEVTMKKLSPIFGLRVFRLFLQQLKGSASSFRYREERAVLREPASPAVREYVRPSSSAPESTTQTGLCMALHHLLARSNP
ncbi:hypothetical protein K469DRAFT_792564 [Zopfia rhizophila CBS 207.26]|uniref:Uncharacterized protein n=1 Tax=Zopfia rhizophila CBS 207.26 TaxID=1314779 RepID=A0A6A6DQU6_9PEZI|nr:hypothetical protein K469DRAFT_792564 [Zopfia rhizophila CBS 207.26]